MGMEFTNVVGGFDAQFQGEASIKCKRKGGEDVECGDLDAQAEQSDAMGTFTGKFSRVMTVFTSALLTWTSRLATWFWRRLLKIRICRFRFRVTAVWSNDKATTARKEIEAPGDR